MFIRRRNPDTSTVRGTDLMDAFDVPNERGKDVRKGGHEGRVTPSLIQYTLVLGKARDRDREK